MPTFLRDLITISEFVAQGDFVLKLTEGTDPAKVKATLDTYVVMPQLAACFDEALKLVQSALKGSSKAAYLLGSFGSGMSHFMAVLSFLLAGMWTRARSRSWATWWRITTNGWPGRNCSWCRST